MVGHGFATAMQCKVVASKARGCSITAAANQRRVPCPTSQSRLLAWPSSLACPPPPLPLCLLPSCITPQLPPNLPHPLSWLSPPARRMSTWPSSPSRPSATMVCLDVGWVRLRAILDERRWIVVCTRACWLSLLVVCVLRAVMLPSGVVVPFYALCHPGLLTPTVSPPLSPQRWSTR